MAVLKGKDFLLKDNSTGSAATVGSMRSTSMTMMSRMMLLQSISKSMKIKKSCTRWLLRSTSRTISAKTDCPDTLMNMVAMIQKMYKWKSMTKEIFQITDQ